MFHISKHVFHIGIWISDLPKFEEDWSIRKNPYVWAACTRFILAKDAFFKTYSPSSDKNTFLLCCFDSKSVESSFEFYEFKVVQNNPTHKTKAHNSWVIIESQKKVTPDANNIFPDILKCPSVLKKPVDNSDMCNVYTLGKYLCKYEFGNDEYKHDTHRGSPGKRKGSIPSKSKGSKSKFEGEFNVIKSIDGKKEGGNLKLLHTIDKKRYNSNGVMSPDPKVWSLAGFEQINSSAKNLDLKQQVYQGSGGVAAMKNRIANSNIMNQNVGSPRFITLNMDDIVHDSNFKGNKKSSKNNLKQFERIPMTKISRRSQDRNSLNRNKLEDKLKEGNGNKKTRKSSKGKVKKRPGSATDKLKQRKLVEVNEMSTPSSKVIKVENQLDQLFEANFSTSHKISDSCRSESNFSVRKGSTPTIISIADSNPMKIPLPPPVLNTKNLLNHNPKFWDYENVISVQAKHIENLQEMCKVYYSHLQKVYSHVQKQPRQVLTARTNTTNKDSSVEGCTVNYENDLTLNQKSKSESYQKAQDNKLVMKLKPRNDVNKLNKLNWMKVQKGNAHDVTELSAAKPREFKAKPVMVIRGLTGKDDGEAPTQERISVKPIIKVNSIEYSAADTKELWEVELKNRDRKYDPNNDVTRKEFNFNESLNNDAGKLFSDDLSCIKSQVGAIPNKEHSDLYGQWLNDSNNEQNPTGEWTFKVPVCQVDSSVDSI